MIQPRKILVVGADVVNMTEGSTEAPNMAWRRGPAGVREQGMYTMGSPGTWEALPPPRETRNEG